MSPLCGRSGVSRRYRRAAVVWPTWTLISLFLLLFVVGSAAAPASSSSAAPFYLLNAMYSLDFYGSANANALWAGIDAAFYAAGDTAGGGRPLVVLQPDISSNLSDIVDVITHSLSNYPTLMGIIGPFSDVSLLTAMSSAVVDNNSLMLLGPFTGSSSVRTWNDNVYFTRSEPMSELKLITTYILNELRATRIAFMYLSNAHYGRREFMALQQLLSSAGRNPPIVYATPYDATGRAVNATAFNAMADANPQVIIVWGFPGDQSFEFSRQVMLDPRTSSAVIISCFGLQQVVFDAYNNVTATGHFTMAPRQILSSATCRPPTDSNVGVSHMQLFEQEMANYVLHSGRSLYSFQDGLSSSAAMGSSSAAIAEAAHGFYSRYSITAQLMVSGWLTGKVIQRTLDRVDWITNRTTYQAGLFEQNRYIIGGDAVFGDYGGPCDPHAAATGAMCYCNQGGHATNLVTLNNDTVWSVMEGIAFTYTQSLCYSDTVELPRPLNVAVFNATDVSGFTQAATRISDVLPETFAFLNAASVSFNMVVLQANTTAQQTLLNSELGNNTIDVLTGPMEDFLDAHDLLVINPVYVHRRPNYVTRNAIIINPTLAQEIYILYASIFSPITTPAQGTTEVNVILHGYSAADEAKIRTILKQTAATFGYQTPRITVVPEGTDAAYALTKTGINFLVGFETTDAISVTNYLVNNPSAYVLLDYKDFSLSYDILLPLFSALDISVQDRLYSFTNMPLWTDTSSDAHADSQLLSLFHEMLSDPTDHTPANLEDMMTACFLNQLAESTDVINSSNMVDMLYLKGTLSSCGMVFGKFSWSCTVTAYGDVCTYQNYGAQDISVFSMSRVLDPSIAAVVGPTTPSMYYTELNTTKGLTKGQLAGVIAGSVVGGLVLIALGLLFVFCCLLSTRDNESAPKKAEAAVTLIFTDIESSTALWAALPQLMPDAIAAHHSIIRAALKKYKCYEVKTIGDSFMIACKDAYAAVKLAKEVQVKFLEHDWKTDDIDEVYRLFELERAQEEEENKPPHTAQLTPDVYVTMWRGLRVRMGIHTGLSDIRLDEVTGGYDYYGDTSNMAARTEAVANGGQVIMTEATWWALSDEDRDELNCTKMGPQGLRGVPYAVEMYQLNPVEGREHCKLRTEIDAVLPDDATLNTAGIATEEGVSLHTSMSTTATAVAFVLSSCFSTYPPPQRIRELQPLLTKWSVASPPRAKGISDEDYCKGLFDRLAVRVGRVTEARIRQNGGDAGARPNLLASMGGLASLNRNPLRQTTSAVAQDFLEDAPLRFREQTAMSELRGVLRSVMTPHSSVRSRSSRSPRRSRRESGFSPPDGLMVFDVSTNRGKVVETSVPAANATSSTMTRRTRRTSGRSDASTRNGFSGKQ